MIIDVFLLGRIIPENIVNFIQHVAAILLNPVGIGWLIPSLIYLMFGPILPSLW